MTINKNIDKLSIKDQNQIGMLANIVRIHTLNALRSQQDTSLVFDSCYMLLPRYCYWSH
jgi:hypothetical protein